MQRQADLQRRGCLKSIVMLNLFQHDEEYMILRAQRAAAVVPESQRCIVITIVIPDSRSTLIYGPSQPSQPNSPLLVNTLQAPGFAATLIRLQ